MNSGTKKLNIMTPTQGVTIGVNPTTVRDPAFGFRVLKIKKSKYFTISLIKFT